MSPPLVTATLLASVSSVAPGQELWLGVRYDIAPGWHIYWHNPGDSGMSTSVDLAAEHLELGPVQWPGPAAIPAAGGLINFGYEGQATLLLPATVQPQAAGELRVTGSTRWLVCKEDLCTPGSAELALDLPVGAAGPGDALARARAALPAPLPDGSRVASHRLELPAGTVTAVFPDRALETVLSGWSVQGPTLSLELSGAAPAGATAVLAVHGASSPFLTWTLPPPESP